MAALWPPQKGPKPPPALLRLLQDTQSDFIKNTKETDNLSLSLTVNEAERVLTFIIIYLWTITVLSLISLSQCI